MDLKRVALVTGGAGALGRGIAARLQKDGCRIVLADINASACEAAARIWEATPSVLWAPA